MNFNLFEIKQKVYNAKAALKQYPEIKTKVKVATNLDPWGPTQKQMEEICQASFQYEERRLIMRALWKRVTASTTKEWPHIHKSLTLMEFLLLNGPDSIVEDMEQKMYNLKTLHDFQAVDDKGKDNGESIREKSKKLVEWVQNGDTLQEERKKRGELKNRISGGSTKSSAPTRTPTTGGSSTEVKPRSTISSSSGSSAAITPKPAATSAAAATTATTTTTLSAEDAYIAELKKNPDFMNEQRQLEESFNARTKSSAGDDDLFAAQGGDEDLFAAAAPAPAAPTPAPAAAPKPVSNDLDLFMSGPTTTTASAAPDLDLFGPAPTAPARPPPAPVAVEDDLFGGPSLPTTAAQQPPTASLFAAEDDLFGGPSPLSSQPVAAAPAPKPAVSLEDDLFGSPTPAPAQQPAAQSKGIFDGFSNIVDLDNLGGGPNPGRPASKPPTAGGQSLNSMKAQHQFENQMSGMGGAPAAPQQSSFDFFSAPSGPPARPPPANPFGGGMGMGMGGGVGTAAPAAPPASNNADFNPFA